MAKRSFALVAVPAVVVAILFPFAVTSAAQAPDQSKSITAWELNKLQVIGWLGHPLGKIVTIEGEVADGSYTNMKVDAGQTLLRVQTVDEKMLPKEQVFHFGPFCTGGVEEPKVGSKFKYIGYETGGFTGVPGKAFEYTPAICTTGFYFTTHFVVLRDELKKQPSPKGILTPPPAFGP